MKLKKMKIVNKIRFSISITLITLTLLLLSSVVINIHKAYSSTYEKYLEIEVAQGDTLWHIAKDHNQHQEDIRKIVYNIMKVNKMETAKINPGDIIKIPIK